MEFEELKTVQTLQKMDSTIHWINLYPVDGAIGFPYSYPLDSDLSSRIALSFPPRPWLFKCWIALSSIWITRAWVENLCIKIKLKLLVWWEDSELQTASKFTEQTEKSGNIALPQITAPVFWSVPNGMVQLNYLIFQPEFHVSCVKQPHCRGMMRSGALLLMQLYVCLLLESYIW